MAKLLSLQDTTAGAAKIYVFGSVLRTDRINDFDVAVVTDNPGALRWIRGQICSDHDLQVVDLTVLNSHEERELDFIRTVGAIEVSMIDWTT